MAHDPFAQFDQNILDLIEHSAVGAVPHTPAHQDSLARLLGSFQVYSSAYHKGGYVTARSLGARPAFHAHNLAAFLSGSVIAAELETDESIFDRYTASLPAERQPAATKHRTNVITRRIHHRAKHGVVARDPVHSLILVPGGGVHPGLPGDYLHGALIEIVGPDDASSTFSLQLHDREDGVATSPEAPPAASLATLQDVLASAPFHLRELEALGFKVA